MSDTPIEVRDTREKGFFMVDDLFVDEYARLLGPSAVIVYLALCRHANKDQKSWPSVARLATSARITKRTVLRVIEKLEAHKLIIVERHPGAKNVYVLTNKTNWSAAETGCSGVTSLDAKTGCSGVTGDIQDTKLVTFETRTSYNGLKDTHRRTHTLARPSAQSAFDQFWTKYPKKRSRGQAEKAWHSIQPDEQLLAVILATIERAKTSAGWQKENGRYIPYPATWLNARGWEDEIDVQVMQEKAKVPQYKIAPKPERRGIVRVDEGRAIGLKEILDRVIAPGTSRGSGEARS